ncbi:MAG: NUDIX domain-containing protein [Candidatus Shapirobacteria bacterium]
MKTILAKIYKALHLSKDFQLFIMRFSQTRFLVGVTGIVFNDRKEILLFKHTYRSHAWSLPGGYLESGEHPRESLEREIKEESGFVVSMDESLKTRTDRDSARLDLCYTGVFIGGNFTPSYEVSEFGFFALDKLPLLRKNQLFLIDLAVATKS